jgi:hypothetical protein
MTALVTAERNSHSGGVFLSALPTAIVVGSQIGAAPALGAALLAGAIFKGFAAFEAQVFKKLQPGNYRLFNLQIKTLFQGNLYLMVPLITLGALKALGVSLSIPKLITALAIIGLYQTVSLAYAWHNRDQGLMGPIYLATAAAGKAMLPLQMMS